MTTLKTGNFEEQRGGHRNLPGNGTMPGPRQSRGTVQLEKAKRVVPLPRPKTIMPKRKVR